MCIIIDANQAHLLLDDSVAALRPVKDWLFSGKKTGILVIGGKNFIELTKIRGFTRLLRALDEAGRVRKIPKLQIEKEETVLKEACNSNDRHIVALARISGARVLCTNDKSLCSDFLNRALIFRPGGHIYKDETHGHLLRKFGHTSACNIPS
jgi:hypothetical protein